MFWVILQKNGIICYKIAPLLNLESSKVLVFMSMLVFSLWYGKDVSLIVSVLLTL